MNVKWMIQDVNIRHDYLEQIAQALSNLGYMQGYVGVIPFSDEIRGLEQFISPDFQSNQYAETVDHEDDIYIFKGCNKIIKIVTDLSEDNLDEVFPLIKNTYQKSSKQYKQQEIYRKNFINKMKRSIFHDMEKFDQEYYSNLNLPLLNDNSIFLKMNESLDLSFDEPKFIKPSTDMKPFAGGIIPSGQTIKDFVTNQRYNACYVDETLMVSDCIDIVSEYRFFVVDGKAVTGSLYKLGDKVTTSEDVPSDLFTFVEDLDKQYRPHDVYTVDIAILENGEYRIVEYNGWNFSGSYKCDLEKTFKAINDYVLKCYEK